MIDPASIVALVAAIDHPARSQSEKKCMERIVGVRRMPVISLFRANALTAVLDDASSLGNFARGETPLPCRVERRTTCQGLRVFVVMDEGVGRAIREDYIDATGLCLPVGGTNIR